MTILDFYEPSFRIECPACHSFENEGQGRDHAIAFLIWKQGMVEPQGQRVDSPLSADKIRAFRLPDHFTFDILCRECGAHLRTCTGECILGVWSLTKIHDA